MTDLTEDVGGEPSIHAPKSEEPALATIHLLVEQNGITHVLHSDTLKVIRFRENTDRYAARLGSRPFAEFDRPQNCSVEISLDFERNDYIDGFYTWKKYDAGELEKEVEEVDVYTLAFAEENWVIMRREHGQDHFAVLAKFGADKLEAIRMLKALSGE